MTTFTRTTVVALLASLSFLSFNVVSSKASQPNVLLLPPADDCYIPKFGFSSFNIAGVGERVTFVRWGGIASKFGLEPGDTILSMNGFPLTYHGSWNDALHRAMSRGGLVKLRIRDVRTGFIAFRQMYVGDGIGPVTPKYHTAGPVGPGSNHNLNNKVKQIVKLFED
jgi:hypothetical protein